MIKVTLSGTNSCNLDSQETRRLMRKIFEAISHGRLDVMMIEFLESQVFTSDGQRPCLQIEATVDVPENTLITIGNRFSSCINTFVRSGKGSMAFREAGKVFKIGCFEHDFSKDDEHGAMGS